MLFNSLTFVVFFLLVLAAYWTLRSWETRKNLLLVASYLFYGAWNPPFALLLFATTALDFFIGSGIDESKVAQVMDYRHRYIQPEHAGVLQVREFRAGEHALAPCPGGYRLQPAAPRH